jgi:hypothetical protein
MTAKLILVLDITAILASEFRGTRDHLLLYDAFGSHQNLLLKTEISINVNV